MGVIQAKAFHMTEPIQILPGVSVFNLTCSDPDLYRFVAQMPCVYEVELAGFYGRHVQISPLYEPDDAWLWIYEQLENESKRVELDTLWNIDNEATDA